MEHPSQLSADCDSELQLDLESRGLWMQSYRTKLWDTDSEEGTGWAIKMEWK